MNPHLANFLFLFFAVGLWAQKKPNVVVMFMDDMGYADIGPFGAKAYPTPNLDRMAKEGRKFTDFYVTQAVCSASRAGFIWVVERMEGSSLFARWSRGRASTRCKTRSLDARCRFWRRLPPC